MSSQSSFNAEEIAAAAEEITTCHCKPGWDLRCVCMPPMRTDLYKEDDISWYKNPEYTDNWDNCPMKALTIYQFFKDSRLPRLDKETKKGTHRLSAAKWFFKLHGLRGRHLDEAMDYIREDNKDILNYN